MAVLRFQAQPDLFELFLNSEYWDDSLPLSEKEVNNLILNKQQAKEFYKHQYRAVARNFESYADHTVFGKHEQPPLLSIRTLGQGSYGLVDETENIYSKDRLARKIVSIRGRILRGKVNHEVANLRKLGLHRHFVQLVGTYEVDIKFGLLFLPVAECNLYDYFKEPTAETNDDFITFLNKFFGCLSSALKFMHNKGVRHKDIKPTNILVYRSTVLLTDFGLARDFGDSSHTFSTSGMMSTGTPEAFTRRYAAPEVLDCEPRNNKSDVFSLGCVFLELWAALTGGGLETLLEGNLEYPTEIIYADLIPKVRSWARKTLEREPDANLEVLMECFLKMVDPNQKKRPSISAVCAEIFAISTKDDNTIEHYCSECLHDMNSGSSADPHRTFASFGLVPERLKDISVEKQQANPYKIYDALRLKANEDYDNLRQRWLEENPNPPLFDFIRNGDTKEVQRLLNDGVDAKLEYKGKSTLHWAADNGFLDVAQLLVERGAELNGRDSSKMTPLHWAAFENHPQLVKYFLNQGADHDTTDQWGDTLLDDARGRFQSVVIAILEEADLEKSGRRMSVLETDGLLSRIERMKSRDQLAARRQDTSSGNTGTQSSDASGTTRSDRYAMSNLTSPSSVNRDLDTAMSVSLSDAIHSQSRSTSKHRRGFRNSVSTATMPPPPDMKPLRRTRAWSIEYIPSERTPEDES